MFTIEGISLVFSVKNSSLKCREGADEAAAAIISR